MSLQHFIDRPRVAGAAATLAVIALATVPAAALTVSVNGQTATLSPPPIERAGRIFVPLRGVFEKLGASVVYEGGVINATGNGHRISLKIGSSQATVDGATQTVDQAPFIVGASTYVPLRFVSQALGAGVNYDGANKVVALTTPTGAASAAAPAASATPLSRVFRDLQPGRDATVGSTKPTVSANFAQPIDPNSLKLALDGLDITAAATRSETGFVYAPPSPLQSIRHQLVATGKLLSGAAFAESYAFVTGTEAPRNSLVLSAPAEGAAVGQNFIVSGHTAPNARVHVVAGATASVGGVFAFGAGNYAGDLTADASGNFSQTVNLQTVSGASIGLTVTSTDPASKESAEKKLRLRAQ